MSRKVDTFMPFFIGDYRRDTSRLNTEQHGAYVLLIIDYWINGAPPDDDEVLAQIVLQDARGWKKIKPRVAHFFRVVDGAWRHKRIDEELDKARARRDVAAENGRNGGRPKKQNITQQKPSGLSGENPEHNPGPNPQENSSPSPLPPEGLNDDDEARALGIWKRRLKEVQDLAGEALDWTSGAIHQFGDLRNFCETSVTEPCEWQEVLDSTAALAAKILADPSRDRIRSWLWLRADVIKRRDRRLKGLPPPQTIDPVNDHERNHPISDKLDRKQAKLAQSQLGADIAAELWRRENPN